jgi:hypothetical protein
MGSRIHFFKKFVSAENLRMNVFHCIVTQGSKRFSQKQPENGGFTCMRAIAVGGKHQLEDSEYSCYADLCLRKMLKIMKIQTDRLTNSESPTKVSFDTALMKLSDRSLKGFQ